MLKYKKVYRVNGRLIIADDIKDAIDIFNEFLPYSEINTVELVTGDDSLITSALIREEDRVE